MYKLKRTLNLLDVLMINLGAMIGAGIFVIIGISIGIAGPSVIFSIIIAGIIALLTGLSFSEIALHTSKEGGVYEYAKDALTPFSGFIGGWAWMFANMIALSAILLSLGSYINFFLGTMIPVIYFAIPALLLFMIINILGMKNSSKTITFLVIVNIIILVIFVAVGAFFFKTSNLTPFLPNGLSGILGGTAIIFFAFTGFSRITTVSGEIKNPKKTIPKAIILSIIISTFLYIAVATVALGMLNYTKLATSFSPLSAAIAVANNKILDAIIAIGGIIALAGVAFTGILGTSRVLFAIGRDHEMPKSLGRIDRFSTPINAILVVTAVAIISMLLIKFSTTIEISNAGLLTAYAIINLAALNLFLNRRRNKSRKTNSISDSKYFPIIPVLGFFTILVVLSYLSIQSLYVMMVILAVGVVYYIFKNSKVIAGIQKAMGRETPTRSIVREFGSSRDVPSKRSD